MARKVTPRRAARRRAGRGSGKGPARWNTKKGREEAAGRRKKVPNRRIVINVG